MILHVLFAIASGCRQERWQSQGSTLWYCADAQLASSAVDTALNWMRPRTTRVQQWTLGRLTRTHIHNLLMALQPLFSASEGCGVDCVWPLLGCALSESRSQQRQDLILLPTLLKESGYQPGTFVELGAYTGVELSNTFMLERCFNWTGLLIEANPQNFAQLAASPRTAMKKFAATCPKNQTPQSVRMTINGTIQRNLATAKVIETARGSVQETVDVPCATLQRHMHDAGMHGKADFLSLDVEGSELAVLQTVDPSVFKVIMVEEELLVSTKDIIDGVRVLLRRSNFVVPKNSNQRDEFDINPKPLFIAYFTTIHPLLFYCYAGTCIGPSDAKMTDRLSHVHVRSS